MIVYSIRRFVVTMSIISLFWIDLNRRFFPLMGNIHLICLSLIFICSACDQGSPIAQVQSIADHAQNYAEDGHEVTQKEDSVEATAARIPLPGGLINSEDHIIFFAPDDPTLALELALIDRMISDCSELETPSQCRIRYAVYNFTSALLTQKLIKAAHEGIKVQVLIEADQLSSSREWNLINERFVEAGLNVQYDQRYINDAERENAHLIGIGGRGLMHLKMRLFEAPTWRKLLTGSLNPNTTAHLNDETLHLISNEDLIYKYNITFDSILYHWPLYNTWDENEPINVLFTPTAAGKRPINQIFKWIAEEQEQILLMIFSLRDLKSEVDQRSLSELLIDKAKEGIPVYVITDRKQSDGTVYNDSQRDDDEMEDMLRAGGIPVYEATNDVTPYTAMHHKVAILGRTKLKVISGAANWSYSGLGSKDQPANNTESVLFIDSFKLDHNYTGYRFLGQWIKTLHRYGHQSEQHDHEQSPSTLISKLTSSDGWPLLDYSFQVTLERPDVQDLGITGDLAQLGWWGTHGYHALLQSEDSNDWYSLNQLSAPLGTPISWKMISLKADGSIDHWEPRGHRFELLSLPLKLGDQTVIKGVWR